MSDKDDARRFAAGELDRMADRLECESDYFRRIHEQHDDPRADGRGVGLLNAVKSLRNRATRLRNGTDRRVRP